MKGIPIKFRAKVIGTGHYITFGLGVELPQGIDKTTITQLVGYDADGNEVYEGDKLYYYRCYCVSGDYIRQNKIPKAGVCTVIDAHCLKGLPYVGLNDHFDYEFLLKTKVYAK